MVLYVLEHFLRNFVQFKWSVGGARVDCSNKTTHLPDKITKKSLFSSHNTDRNKKIVQYLIEKPQQSLIQ